MKFFFNSITDRKILAKEHRNDGKYKEAIQVLDDLINELEISISEVKISSSKRRLKEELADTYGIRGGIFRRQALSAREEYLIASIESYDLGYKYETGSTYNKLNRLISRILDNPKFLNDSSLKVLDMKNQKSKSMIEELIEIRDYINNPNNTNFDEWAKADLGLVKSLLNEGSPESNFEFMLIGKPLDKYVYKSLLSTLVPLSKLKIKDNSQIKKATALIQAKMLELG